MSDTLYTTMRVQRARRNLTQAQLAELSGITRKSINAIESGRMVPSIVLALKLARALGVGVDALFSFEPGPDLDAMLDAQDAAPIVSSDA